jgi:NodT family efflux transporter outer membrane factor (OMF) lipoprotein
MKHVMKRFTSMPTVIGLAAVITLNGCALTRGEPTQADLPLPAAWNESPSGIVALREDWWADFNSRELNDLIAQALQDSPDVRVAAERVKQAEAAMRSAGASLFPSLGLSASSGSRRSDSGGTAANTTDSSSAALSVSYEVDLWGRVDAGVRSAEASLDGSRFDLQTARLTLTSGVANAYFQLLSLRDRLRVARDNLVLAERLMKIVEVRYRSGSATSLDVSRQRTAVLTQQAAITPLEVQARQARNALAVLVGRVPEGFGEPAGQIAELGLPEARAGLPSDLLTRRPDLAKAESTLRGADADVDAARAALLPTISLSGSGGLASSALLSLADPTRTLSLTGSLAQTLFDGGRLRSQVTSSEAARRSAVESYRKAVLTSLQEVEDALANVARYREQEQQLAGIRDQAQLSLNLSELRYRQGADDLSTVIDAQRTLFSAQDQVTQNRLSRLTAAVDLVKVLGGGWQRPQATTR